MALQIAPALPPVPPPQAGNAAATPESGEPSGFARLLKGQAEARPADDEPRAAARPDDGGKTDPAEASARTDDADASATHDDDDQAAAGSPGVDPALAHWLAGLHLPPAAEARPLAGHAAAGANDGATDGAAGDATLGAVGGHAARPGAARGHAERGAGLRAGAEARGGREAAGTDQDTRLPAAGEAAGAKAVAADTGDAAPKRAAGLDGEHRAAVFELPAAPAAGGVSGPHPAAHATGSAAPLDVQLPAGPADADFGDALATQVSVLARDGVQQAQLHLNPAETGPVSVQIVLDGTQARIDFGADAQPTRQAIEQSLPELAAALREQGLTLSGGGVSEHARGRQEPPAEPGSGGTRRGAAAEAAPAVRTLRVPQRAGGLDLYA